MTANEKAYFDLKFKGIREMSADEMLRAGIVSYPSFWNKCSTAFWTAVASGLNRIGAKKSARSIVEQRTALNSSTMDRPEETDQLAELAFRLTANRDSQDRAIPGRDPFYDSAEPADLIVKFRKEESITT